MDWKSKSILSNPANAVGMFTFIARWLYNHVVIHISSLESLGEQHDENQKKNSISRLINVAVNEIKKLCLGMKTHFVSC